ncbi:Hypothetical protein FKW44_009460, partial [Caligus rogercresseyi]
VHLSQDGAPANTSKAPEVPQEQTGIHGIPVQRNVASLISDPNPLDSHLQHLRTSLWSLPQQH